MNTEELEALLMEVCDRVLYLERMLNITARETARIGKVISFAEYRAAKLKAERTEKSPTDTYKAYSKIVKRLMEEEQKGNDDE